MTKQIKKKAEQSKPAKTKAADSISRGRHIRPVRFSCADGQPNRTRDLIAHSLQKGVGKSPAKRSLLAFSPTIAYWFLAPDVDLGLLTYPPGPLPYGAPLVPGLPRERETLP